jgi:hypothetical protein
MCMTIDPVGARTLNQRLTCLDCASLEKGLGLTRAPLSSYPGAHLSPTFPLGGDSDLELILQSVDPLWRLFLVVAFLKLMWIHWYAIYPGVTGIEFLSSNFGRRRWNNRLSDQRGTLQQSRYDGRLF